MSLLTPLPINYQNAAIEQQTLKGIVHLATVLTESYDRFWNLKPEVNELLGFVGRTPEAIVADLNSDYALANERNVKHYMMATTVNGSQMQVMLCAFRSPCQRVTAMMAKRFHTLLPW